MLTRRSFLAWLSAAWSGTTMADDNCYWIEEFGATEACAVENLPPLPEYWVRWDADPAPATGRTSNNATDLSANAAKPLAGNGIIVNAARYYWGDHANTYTTATYAVHTSTDDGFTYSDPPIEYAAWERGSALGGYTAVNGNYDTNYYHFGTRGDFDGTRFVLINSYGTNTGYSGPNGVIRVATSTDGLSWVVTDSTTPDNAVLQAAAYGGDMWYLGHRGLQWTWGDNNLYYQIAYSNNDGTSWAVTSLGSVDLVPNRNNLQEHYTSLSANALGCHVVGEIYDFNAPNDFGFYYWRPTSVSTWAAPILLWDEDNNIAASSETADDAGIGLVASRIDPNFVCSAVCGASRRTIWFRKSVDGGANWNTPIIINQFADFGVYSEDWWFVLSQNRFELLELDNGALVCVLVYEAYYPGYDTGAGLPESNIGWTAYVMSEDGGDNWSQLTLVSDFWVADGTSSGQRMEACAKGNDVVVTCTADQHGSFTWVIRPTMTPDGEFLVPPSMTLPPIPTYGNP